MSQVLAELIAPWDKEATSDAEYDVLLALAVVAWNISLLPEEEQQPMIDEYLARGMPGAGIGTINMADRLLSELKKRKQTLYPDVQRLIVDYKVTRSGDKVHLKVTSGALSHEGK